VMKKIEAIIRHERLQEVQDALDQLGVSGLTVSEVVGCGRQKGYTEQYRGVRANISLLPKIKVESVVPSDVADSAVDAIVAAARTGAIGDGRVFVYEVEQSIRIRTGEDGEDSVRHEEPVGWGH
jgi:nitrogen regulatory protein P-II 1